MKIIKLLSTGIILLLSCMFLSCKKNMQQEASVDLGSSLSIPNASPVDGALRGMILDENNLPVKDAEVHFGAHVTATDIRGGFFFPNITLDKYISTVSVIKAGYFKGIRSFSATAATNYVNIKLIPKVLAGTFNSGDGGTVSLSNGTSIAFQAGSIVLKSSAAAFSGQVQVYAAYIDPTASDIGMKVPGNFTGRDSMNIFLLRSAGMIAIELESVSGDALQLAMNKPALMRMPILPSLLNNAPATIDTWSLDDNGIWLKEGVATKSGNYYESAPTHFSFWNYDSPYSGIFLNVHVQDQFGDSISNATVQLSIPSNPLAGIVSGQTNNMGTVLGYATANTEMQMDIFLDPLLCATPIYTQTVGPFTSNANIVVTINLNPSQLLTVSGTATDCSSQPLQNGTAVVYNSAYGYHDVPIVNGSYSCVIAHCAPINSVSVIVLDNNNVTGNNSGNLAVSGNVVTVPPLMACNIQPAVFSFHSSPNCNGYFYGEYAVNEPLSVANVFSMSVDVSIPGTYTIATNSINGISFSGTGVFATTGQHMISLAGTGTPISQGTYNFSAQAAGTTGCSQSLTVLPQQAIFSLNGPGSCFNVIISGNYYAGLPLTAANTVSFTVDVTTPGAYYINSGYGNGIQFRDSGIFVSTGPHTVILGGNGFPISAATTHFTPGSIHGGPACSFNVTTTTAPPAFYTFDGAPGSCTNSSVSGIYHADSTLNGYHYIMLTVNVTSIGSYSIITNTANGISFSNTGVFITTGLHTVYLSGSGTVLAAGTNIYIPQAQGITTTGCNVSITSN